MNRTKIEYADYSWNPVTGCYGPGGTAEQPNWCPYCWAKKQAERGMGPYGQFPKEQRFRPRIWEERLLEPNFLKKPSRILVCFMGDLFGDWVPEEWIRKITVTPRLPWVKHHTFLFLTKNPKRLPEFNPWPENAWIGATATDNLMMNDALHYFDRVEASLKFLSLEPMLEAIDPGALYFVDWVIIGSLTGPGVNPLQKDWIEPILLYSERIGLPIFLKENLLKLFPDLPRRQEYPGVRR